MRTHLSILALAFVLALPVALVLAQPKPAATPGGALVLVIDRSGSMMGPKLEAAKTAAKAAISAMNPSDHVAVVVYNSDAAVLVGMQRSANRATFHAALDKLQPGGGTNIFPGLKEAYSLLRASGGVKQHVILLSDGEAPFDGISDLVKDMYRHKITVSTVAVPGADAKLLESISKDGGGRMYKVSDLKTLSEVYVKELKAAQLAAK